MNTYPPTDDPTPPAPYKAISFAPTQRSLHVNTSPKWLANMRAHQPFPTGARLLTCYVCVYVPGTSMVGVARLSSLGVLAGKEKDCLRQCGRSWIRAEVVRVW